MSMLIALKCINVYPVKGAARVGCVLGRGGDRALGLGLEGRKNRSSLVGVMSKLVLWQLCHWNPELHIPLHQGNLVISV